MERDCGHTGFVIARQGEYHERTRHAVNAAIHGINSFGVLDRIIPPSRLWVILSSISLQIQRQQLFEDLVVGEVGWPGVGGGDGGVELLVGEGGQVGRWL